MSCFAHNRSEAGFTLVELLVSLTLLALLSLALFNGMHLGSQVWRQSQETITHENRVRAAKAEIGNLIAHLYPKFGSQAAIDFYGGTDKLSFLAPDDRNPGSLNRITIAATNGALVLSQTPELAPSLKPQIRVLLRGVHSLALFYYGAKDSRSAALWAKQWNGNDRPPALIQLQIDLGETEPVSFTEAPRTQADIGCSYSVLTAYCEGRP